MPKVPYSDKQKLDLFVDWLGCNGDALDELCLDTDFRNGFRKKLFRKFFSIRKTSYGNHEATGVIDRFLGYVLLGMKERHKKEKYNFVNINAVYKVIHNWIGFDNFQKFYSQEDEDSFSRQFLFDNRLDSEEIELYEDGSSNLEIDNIGLDNLINNQSKKIQFTLGEILRKFEFFLRKKSRKNSNDYLHFLNVIIDGVNQKKLKNVLENSSGDKKKKKYEMLDANIDNITNLLVIWFLAPPEILHQDEIKTFIKDETNYDSDYGESLKRIRKYWKEFIYDKQKIEEQVDLYQQLLRNSSDKKIQYHYKISDDRKNY